MPGLQSVSVSWPSFSHIRNATGTPVNVTQWHCIRLTSYSNSHSTHDPHKMSLSHRDYTWNGAATTIKSLKGLIGSLRCECFKKAIEPTRIWCHYFQWFLVVKYWEISQNVHRTELLWRQYLLSFYGIDGGWWEAVEGRCPAEWMIKEARSGDTRGQTWGELGRTLGSEPGCSPWS